MVNPGRGRERDGPNPFIPVMPPGVDLLEEEEGLPILETALIARKLRPVFLTHECHPISAAQGIHEAGFLRPPTCSFILRDRVELLLEPAPLDA